MVDLFIRKPACSGFSKLCCSAQFVNFIVMIFSNILDRLQINEMGL